MKKITIAFDVDWTLINTWLKLWNEINISRDEDIIMTRIVQLLISLASFKNTKIIVWSGQWEKWAKEVINNLALQPFVDWYASKNHKGKNEEWVHIFEPDIVPDIAIDDIQACELWLLNLIVREK